jgi:glycosyltransferase involved in cell wall biosynthesis
MRVWIVTVGEPLPTDDSGSDRLLRTGILAELLARNGHEVTWWTSAFDHVRKRHRAEGDRRVTLAAGYHLWLLHANGYPSNVSLRRVLNHRTVAKKFRTLAPQQPPPDVIVCSWPTVELCVEAVRLGKLWGVPVVLDIRDLWPDAITDLAPRALRPAAKMVLRHAYKAARYAASQATAITGITEQYVDWGVGYTGRQRTFLDRPFPLGYADKQPNTLEIRDAERFWSQLGIAKEDNHFIACWFGMMGNHSELATVIEAARRLSHFGSPVRFVLCGTGPNFERCRRLAGDCQNVLLPGWVNAAQIWTLLRLSSVGLTPYVSNNNYIRNIPNKPVEYLSAGLPIVSSLQGELATLLADNGCGLTCQNGSADDLVRVLADCYDHPEKCALMAKNAASLYEDRFVAETVYGQMSDFLCGLADGKHRSRAA